MARKIFVGSLPSGVTEDLLRSEFDRFGRIDEVFIKDRCSVLDKTKIDILCSAARWHSRKSFNTYPTGLL